MTPLEVLDAQPRADLGHWPTPLQPADRLRNADIARIVVAASTSGTAAGLVLGTALGGLDATIDIACVFASVADTEPLVRDLIAGGAALLGCESPSGDRWTITDATLGEGYGIPSRATLDAVELLARIEGVLLDPVYTGKAFEHLLAQVAAGAYDDDRDVVFLHTGGTPGLFAYTDEFTER